MFHTFLRGSQFYCDCTQLYCDSTFLLTLELVSYLYKACWFRILRSLTEEYGGGQNSDKGSIALSYQHAFIFLNHEWKNP